MKKSKNLLSNLTILSVSLFLLSITFLAVHANADYSNTNRMHNFNSRLRTGYQLFNNGLINREITSISNGAEAKITSDDKDTITKIQDNKDRFKIFQKFNENIEISTQDIDNGVLVKATTTDPDTLKEIHNHVEIMNLMQSLREQNIDIQEEINKKVDNLNNGVRIELTSDNKDIVKLLQTRAQNNNIMNNTWRRNNRFRMKNNR